MKLVQIIFTPAFQAQANCQGPSFENPESCDVTETGGVVVTTGLSPADLEKEMFTEDDTAVYYYPPESIARVKIIE